MIIRPLNRLTSEIYNRVLELLHEGHNWTYIVVEINRDFDLHFDLHTEAFQKWQELTVYGNENLDAIRTQLRKHGYMWFTTDYDHRIYNFNLLSERNIDFICIENYASDRYEFYIKESQFSNNLAIIGQDRYDLLENQKWTNFHLYQSNLLINSIKNVYPEILLNDLQSIIRTTVDVWIKENNIAFYHIIHNDIIYFEREADAVLFKLQFV